MMIRRAHLRVGLGPATPLQHGLARALGKHGFPDPAQLRERIQRRREWLTTGLAELGLTASRPAGGWYLFANAREIGLPSDQLAIELAKTTGVLLAPGTVFYHHRAAGQGWLRISLIRPDDEIEQALHRFSKFFVDRRTEERTSEMPKPTRHERYTVLRRGRVDSYQPAVERIYQDDPELWKAILGSELWFHFGVYDDRSASSLDQAGERYFDQQLKIAGAFGRPPPRRILDVRFGWGATLLHLARKFPNCPRIDGINISVPQIEYAADRLRTNSAADRVRLYHCNAQDIALVPDTFPRYDLVIFRGSIAHLPIDALNEAVGSIAERAASGATLIIADSLQEEPGLKRMTVNRQPG